MLRFGRRARAATEPVEPLWVDLTEPDTLDRFAEAAARWASSMTDGARDTVTLACDLLVEGFDAPALRDLASFSVDAAWWDSRDVLEATCREIGVQFADRDSDEARLRALRSLCRRFLTGGMPDLEFTRAAFVLFNYNAPAIAQNLSNLYNDCDCDFCAQAPDQAILADEYARAFLAAGSTGSTTEN